MMHQPHIVVLGSRKESSAKFVFFFSKEDAEKYLATLPERAEGKYCFDQENSWVSPVDTDKCNWNYHMASW